MKLKDLLRLMVDIAKRIEIDPPFIVGGTGRDKVLGLLKEIQDIDITTGNNQVQFLTKELAIELGRYFSFDLKHMPDGHSSLTLGNLKVDFSSNFNAPNIEGILLSMGIKNPTDMQKELFSRDFTCNTLLLDLDLKTIKDPTNLGLKDIKEKLIRTCLAPEITFTTNKNRVVRAIYLAAKLDFSIDPKAMEWITTNPDSIKNSSSKALVEKLEKAVEYDSDKTAYLLSKMGLWNYIPITEKVYPIYEKHLKGQR